jgi:cytochrome c oxidase subunit 4
MSTATAEHIPEAHADHVHAHPTTKNYVVIAAILAVVTGLEVSTYFWEDLVGSKPSTLALVVVLFPMMIFKFVMVIAYFMHLKYDNKLFRRVFVFGMALAIAVFMAVFAAFDFWSDDYLRFLKA